MLRVCVVGLGKIGLPLALQCAGKEGVRVTGCDANPNVVREVNNGVASFVSEPGLEDALRHAVTSGAFIATTDTSAACGEADVILIVVPVALNDAKEVDFQHLDNATSAVGAGLRPGTLVVYETTVPVGTTRRRIGSRLESGSGLVVGNDFSLAFSPERVYSGRIFSDLASYPKVVGGVDGKSTERAAAFYRTVLDAPVMEMSSVEAAEYVKLVETTYRDVNIALANEYALFAEHLGLDIAEVIAAANTQPFSHVHSPSVGVGGHCIPVYPYFLFRSWGGFRLPPLARGINDGMAAHGVDLIERALGPLDNLVVLILGLTYRENVRETANTSARKLCEELTNRGARVLGHDPLLTSKEQQAMNLEPVDLEPRPRVDVVIVQAYHSVYRDIDIGSFPGLRLLLDGRGALSAAQQRSLQEAGIQYLRVGTAEPRRASSLIQ